MKEVEILMNYKSRERRQNMAGLVVIFGDTKAEVTKKRRCCAVSVERRHSHQLA
jgi:heterodisulfide reductase subunit B